MKKKSIIEKELGITGDYQFKALRSSNYLQSNWHRNKLFALDKLINEYRPKTILDLGPGSGNFEIAYAKKVKRITAMDYNPDAISFLKSELEKRKIRNVKLINKDVLTLPKSKLPDKYDVIILVDILEHLETKPALMLIKHFKKMLNKKGKVVVITPNYMGLWPLVEKLIDKFTNIPHLEDMQHVTKYTPEKLKDTFTKSGFRSAKFTTFNTISYLFPSKTLSTTVCNMEIFLKSPFGNLIKCVFEKD